MLSTVLLSNVFLVILGFCVEPVNCENSKDLDVKDVAEEWFTQQAVGLLGKKFLEKVKCPKFISYFQEKYPEHYGTSPKYSKDQVSSVVSDILAVFRNQLYSKGTM
jgi:hypothetical protein